KFYSEAGYKCDCEKDGKGGWGYDPYEKEMPFLRSKKFVPWNWGFGGQTNNHPVVNVSLNDAQAFCEWLSTKESKRYRLPKDSEWEYAARAGSTAAYYFGDDSEKLAEFENVADASARKTFPNWKTINADDGFTFTAPVGSFRPNPFGLYDMLGNVRQWCLD